MEKKKNNEEYASYEFAKFYLKTIGIRSYSEYKKFKLKKNLYPKFLPPNIELYYKKHFNAIHEMFDNEKYLTPRELKKILNIIDL